jgi:glutathione S-transferase
LIYFNGRGVIENARILLAIAGVQYEDYRYPIDIATYARPEFDEDKKKNIFDVNMGRIPILEVNGVQIGQSKPIERFIARESGLMGSNSIEAALIDMVTEHVRDIKQAYNDAKAGKTGEDQKAAKTEFITNPEKLPSWFAKLEKTLSGNGFGIINFLSLL